MSGRVFNILRQSWCWESTQGVLSVVDCNDNYTFAGMKRQQAEENLNEEQNKPRGDHHQGKIKFYFG